MADGFDAYKILQVDSEADDAVIQAAYRRLAHTYHPDVAATPEAAARMASINAAWDLVGTPEARAAYDRSRATRPSADRSTGSRATNTGGGRGGPRATNTGGGRGGPRATNTGGGRGGPRARLAGAIVVLGVAGIGALMLLRPGAGGSAPSPSPEAPAKASTTCPTSQPEPLPAGETRTVTIETDKGAIAIRIEAGLSPIAAGNFVALAGCGFYDGSIFHRVVPGFVIQGGASTATQDGGPGYAIQDEPVTATYSRGTVAMARTAEPNSVTSQFFIVLDDGARAALASYNTYQIIGTVSSGMDAVDAVAAAADAENPSNPEVMTKVTVSTP